jgi:putative acetyltransferase
MQDDPAANRVRIRPEAAGDAAAIEALTVAAFRDHPHSGHTEQHIVRALRAAGQLTVSLVAIAPEGELIGHVAVSPVAMSDGTRGWYGLGPISVQPARQRLGIGTRLMHAALDALRALGASGCVLVGEPTYYGRFGFRAEPALTIPGVPPEYFQALVLAGPLPHATVTFHPAFDATG